MHVEEWCAKGRSGCRAWTKDTPLPILSDNTSYFSVSTSGGRHSTSVIYKHWNTLALQIRGCSPTADEWQTHPPEEASPPHLAFGFD